MSGPSINVNGITTGRLSGNGGLNFSNISKPFGFKYVYDQKVKIEALDGTLLDAVIKTRTGAIGGNVYDLQYVDSMGYVFTAYGIPELAIFPVDTNQKEEAKPVCNHEFVNVSFNRIKMVCKHCDIEQNA